MPRTSLSIFGDPQITKFQNKLLNYHKTNIPNCNATLWDNPVVQANASILALDSRVYPGAFPGLEATCNIVTEGESTTIGTSLWEYDAWPERLMQQSNWTGKGLLINQAVGSQSVAEITAQYAQQIFPNRPQGDVTKAWLIVMIGIKDARPGGTPPPASTIMSAIESYLTTANNDGFTTVLLTTNYSTTMTTDEKQCILDLNTLIMASTVPAYKVDTVAAIGQPDVFPSRYTDSVHPNGTGFDLIAGAINAAITP